MKPFTLLKRADATPTEAAVDNVGFMMKSPIFFYMGSPPLIHNGWWGNKMPFCA
jgi:hypothetical protein